MADWTIPGMTPLERKLFDRLTEDEQRNVHYEGWCAVWDKLSESEQASLIDEFEMYGDR